METRTCNSCGEEKPLAAFSRKQSYCRPCRAIRSAAAYRAAPEKAKAAMRAYYAAHRQESAENGRRWREQNPEKAAVMYRRSNARGRAATRETDLSVEAEVRMWAEAKDCPICGVVLADTHGLPESKHVDHVVPLAVGGLHVRSNVRIICARCNKTRPHDGSDVDHPITRRSFVS